MIFIKLRNCANINCTYRKKYITNLHNLCIKIVNFIYAQFLSTAGAVISVVELAGMISEGEVPAVPLRISALESLLAEEM